MKKLLPSLLFLGFAASAHAQTSAGRYLVSGLINYNKSENKFNGSMNSQKSDYKILQLTTTVGYFIADNLAIGLSGNINNGKQIQTNDPNQGRYTYGYTTNSFGPFVRYYKMITEKLGLYGQLDGGYTTGNSYSTSETSSSQSITTRRVSKGGMGAITPGLVFFPTEKLGLQLVLGNISYVSTKDKSKSPAPVNDFGAKSSYFVSNFGLAYLNVGASLHLGGK
ncbi:hypothetical protein [Hymenobacter tenuis]